MELPTSDQLLTYIDAQYLVIFILLTYGLKGLVHDGMNALISAVTKKPSTAFDKKYSVFIIATGIAIPFLALHPDMWLKLLITYAVGTSLYDIIISALLTGVTKIIPKGDAPVDTDAPDKS